MAAALAQVKRELGPDAVILHTRTYRQGGVFGVGAKPVVEITATDEAKTATRPPSKRRGVVERTYSSASQSAPQVASNTAATANALSGGSSSTAVADPPSQAPLSPAAPPADTQLADELRQLRRLVQRVARSTAGSSSPGRMPDALQQQYLALLEQDVADEIADEIAERARQRVGEDSDDPASLRRAVCAEIAKLIPVDTSPARTERHDDGRPHTIALVGPTGVGKTTTLAKLAANFRLRDKRSVGMVTLDTYRIAAVDQLKTYAQIIGVPLHVVRSPMEVRQALDQCSDCDVVLIDTAGRSQRDRDKLQQLQAMLDAAQPHETHLVLSGAAGERVLMEAVDRFGAMGIDRVIWTKLDESASFGVLLNVMNCVKKQLSYVTTGQDVPNDIERGHARRLAEMILGDQRENASA